MTKSSALTGKKVRIRLMNEDDLPYILEANHNLDIEQISGGIYPMYIDELREFYEGEVKDWAQCFMIEDKKTGSIIGEVGIHDIHQRNQTGELSITLFDPKNHRKGYGSDALDIILCYAFEYLSLRKLIAWIYEANIPSMKLFEKKGFECNGRHKAHRMYRGRYDDMLLYEKFRDSLYENTLGSDR